jgi:predicted phage terminase large subunit-like protein
LADVDLPHQSKLVQSIPSDYRADIAVRIAGDLYVFSKSIMGFTDMTERCHGPMCVFLDSEEYDEHGVLKNVSACGMPRATFKTSVGTISRNLQKLCQNRNRTKAIFNESATNAQGFLRAIKQTAEGNKLFRTFWSDLIPRDTKKVRWNDSQLDFNREINRPEPSISAHGITSTLTSQHWDDLTFDDIISEEAAASEKVMQDATARARRYRPLMVHPTESTLTINFTRWGFADTYSVLFREVGSRLRLLLRGAIENDELIFPERLNWTTLAQIRRELGEYMFSCLYMNNPRNVEVQDFNVDDLRTFTFAEDYTVVVLLDGDGVEFRRYRVDQLEIYATVDLAPAEKITSDRNALTVCGVTPTGEALVLESWAKRCNPIELMTKVFELHRMWRPKVWGIEDVAYQAAFKYFLRDYADREELYLNVRPIKSISRKETRIRGLQPIAATHRLYVLPTQHILRSELADFPLGEHDDAADSLSMQLQLWENQMSPQRWRRYKQVENEVLAEIEREHNLSTGGYLSGPVSDPEDNLDLIQTHGPIGSWSFPES